MVITSAVYRMVPATAIRPETLSGLDAGGIAGALFYSRRTAESFVHLAAGRLGRPATTRLGMLCLSEAIAAPLLSAHFVRVSLAEHPSEEAMLGLALSFAREQNPS
jgi:uroporphyrinogen-III synthase